MVNSSKSCVRSEWEPDTLDFFNGLELSAEECVFCTPPADRNIITVDGRAHVACHDRQNWNTCHAQGCGAEAPNTSNNTEANFLHDTGLLQDVKVFATIDRVKADTLQNQGLVPDREAQNAINAFVGEWEPLHSAATAHGSFPTVRCMPWAWGKMLFTELHDLEEDWRPHAERASELQTFVQILVGMIAELVKVDVQGQEYLTKHSSKNSSDGSSPSFVTTAREPDSDMKEMLCYVRRSIDRIARANSDSDKVASYDLQDSNLHNVLAEHFYDVTSEPHVGCELLFFDGKRLHDSSALHDGNIHQARFYIQQGLCRM